MEGRRAGGRERWGEGGREGETGRESERGKERARDGGRVELKKERRRKKAGGWK